MKRVLPVLAQFSPSRYLARLSLSHSIYIGFAAVLLLLGMIAVVGVAGLEVVVRSFRVYERTADGVLSLSVVERTVAGMLSDVMVYMNGDERALPRIRKAQQVVMPLLDAALKSAEDGEQTANIVRMTAVVDAYVSNIDQLIELKQRRDYLINDVMLPLGWQTQARLQHIIYSSMAIEDYKGAALAGRAQELLLTTLLSSTLFLSKTDDSLVEGAETRIDPFVEAIDRLAKYIIDPALVDESYEAGKAGPKGRDAFLAAASTVSFIKLLANDIMAAQEAEIADLARDAGISLRARLATTNAETGETITATRLWAVVLTLVAAVVGLFQSWRVATHLVARTDEIQKANHELEAARQRMHDAIESISEGFVLWDADDRLVMCNTRYREIYAALAPILEPGVPFSEVAATAARLQHPVPEDQREEWVARRLEAHRNPGATQEQRMQDGRVVLASERRTSEGGVVGVRTDVTALKSMEAQLVQSSKLATLGEMATGIAHEINQPLTIMRMAAEKSIKFLTRGGPEHLPSVSEKLTRIIEQVDRARAITDHMRTFGRKASDQAEPFELKAVADSVLGFIGEQLTKRGIKVELEAADRGPVSGSAIQLEQVVMNLLTNARDAIEAQAAKAGRDHPRRVRMRIASDAEAGRAVLTVADTGGGIPDSVISRIFDPFFTTKEVGKGTGLGLSISYGIITNMGGTISVENADDGALFTISLPLRSKEERHG